MKTQRAVNVKGVVEKRVLLIERYYNESGSTMPFKEFEQICKTPFLHMKKHLSTDEIYEIRFRYLGKFMPVPSNIVWRLKHNLQRFMQSLITKEEYDKLIKGSVDYIKEKPETFARFGDDLKPFIK